MCGFSFESPVNYDMSQTNMIKANPDWLFESPVNYDMSQTAKAAADTVATV